jgi:hypothetical protein
MFENAVHWNPINELVRGQAYDCMVSIPLTVIPSPPTSLPKLTARLEMPYQRALRFELNETRLNTPDYFVANPALAINEQAHT